MPRTRRKVRFGGIIKDKSRSSGHRGAIVSQPKSILRRCDETDTDRTSRSTDTHSSRIKDDGKRALNKVVCSIKWEADGDSLADYAAISQSDRLSATPQQIPNIEDLQTADASSQPAEENAEVQTNNVAPAHEVDSFLDNLLVDILKTAEATSSGTSGASAVDFLDGLILSATIQVQMQRTVHPQPLVALSITSSTPFS